MKYPKQPDAKRNYFYPNCGCKVETDCIPCPHCGMCIAKVEFCACRRFPSNTDESLRYDPHNETMGG